MVGCSDCWPIFNQFSSIIGNDVIHFAGIAALFLQLAGLNRERCFRAKGFLRVQALFGSQRESPLVTAGIEWFEIVEKFCNLNVPVQEWNILIISLFYFFSIYFLSLHHLTDGFIWGALIWCFYLMLLFDAFIWFSYLRLSSDTIVWCFQLPRTLLSRFATFRASDFDKHSNDFNSLNAV